MRRADDDDPARCIEQLAAPVLMPIQFEGGRIFIADRHDRAIDMFDKGWI
jgi:hypothetical protein